jgi:hypothetical protein
MEARMVVHEQLPLLIEQLRYMTMVNEPGLGVTKYNDEYRQANKLAKVNLPIVLIRLAA